MSYEHMSSIELLTKVVMPKLIDRVKAVEADVTALNKKVEELSAQTATPCSYATPTKRKRRTKEEKAVVANVEPAPAQSAQKEVAPSLPLIEAGAPVQNEAAPSVIGVTDAGTAVVTASEGTETGDDLSEKSATPEIVEGYEINGLLIQAVQYVENQGFLIASDIAQTLGIPHAVVERVQAMDHATRIAVWNQFPPVAQSE